MPSGVRDHGAKTPGHGPPLSSDLGMEQPQDAHRGCRFTWAEELNGISLNHGVDLGRLWFIGQPLRQARVGVGLPDVIPHGSQTDPQGQRQGNGCPAAQESLDPKKHNDGHEKRAQDPQGQRGPHDNSRDERDGDRGQRCG